MKGRYIVTTDNWFNAPDGQQYRAVWGEVEIVEDTILGIKTNRNSSNWFAKVGNEDNHVIIAGCQIHYAVKCESKPKTKGEKRVEFSQTKGEGVEYHAPNQIYIIE